MSPISDGTNIFRTYTPTKVLKSWKHNSHYRLPNTWLAKFNLPFKEAHKTTVLMYCTTGNK